MSGSRLGIAAAFGGGHPGQEPGQELPVAPHPAMEALQGGQEIGRVVLQHQDVRDQAGAAVEPLEEIVAEERVLRHAAGQAGLEGGRIVDPLAGVDADAEEVLVDVRHRPGVEVEPGLTGEQAREAGAPGLRRHRHPRLEDGVPGHHPAFRVALRLVQGVGEGGGQANRGAPGQEGVRVQGDHVAHGTERLEVALAGGEAGVRLAGQEPVELGELAALALPAHPDPLGRIPAPFAMEEEEARPAAVLVPVIPGPLVVPGPLIPPFELADALHGQTEELRVPGHLPRGSVDEVREQGEAQVPPRVAQEADLQGVEQRADLVLAGEHARYADQGAAVAGQILLESHPGQQPGPQAQGDQGAHEAHRHGARRQQKGRAQDGEPVDGGSQGGGPEQGEDRDHQRGHPDASEIGKRGMAPDPPAGAGLQGRPVAEAALQEEPALADQVEAHVPRPPGRRLRRRLPRQEHGGARHLGLALPAALGQLLDLLAVAVAGGEVHAGVHAGRVLPQLFLHPAGALHEGPPVGGREGAQGEDVVGDALYEVLLPFGRGGPGQERVGRADQILDGLQPQERRQAPELAQRQGALGLPGIDGAPDPLEAERPGNVGPGLAGEHRDPELSAEGAVPHHRQRAAEGRGEIFTDLAEGALDQVGVVEQPLGRVGESPGAGPESREAAQEVAQGAFELGPARGQRAAGAAPAREPRCRGDAIRRWAHGRLPVRRPLTRRRGRRPRPRFPPARLRG